jgi:hypothetical protein
MKFQLILLASSLLAQPFDVTAKALDPQNDQLVGLVDSSTRTQLDQATEEINSAIKNLLGLELAKLQLLGDKNGENSILKELKPKNGNEKKEANNNVKKDEKKKDSGLVNDLLDVVTIPGN